MMSLILSEYSQKIFEFGCVPNLLSKPFISEIQSNHNVYILTIHIYYCEVGRVEPILTQTPIIFVKKDWRAAEDAIYRCWILAERQNVILDKVNDAERIRIYCFYAASYSFHLAYEISKIDLYLYYIHSVKKLFIEIESMHVKFYVVI